MEPEIRYCTTEDGVRIAYTVTGKGHPLVYLSDPGGSHVQLEWSQTVVGPTYTELSRHNTLIRLDLRGSGLSDRTLPAAMTDWVLDIEAVVGRLGLDEFSLAAVVSSTPSAIAFAARHSDRVRRLVLIDGWASGAGIAELPQGRALQTLSAIDYTLATELVGVMAYGSGRDEVRDQGAYTRACVGPDYLKHLPLVSSWDARAECTAVRAPTLILHHRGLAFVTEEQARDLAARIADSRLSVLNGTFADDQGGLAQRIAEFINDREIERASAERAPAERGSRSGTAIILFADIVDSTALTERLGDAAFRARARDLDDALRTIIRDNSGAAIDGFLSGDGVLATFPAASQAIDAALRCGSAGEAQGLPLHLGLHAGDVIREQNNVFGGAVNIAARISALSAPGEVLVSDIVRGLARTSAGVTFEDRGEQALKGVGEPVRVFAVRQSEAD